MKFILLSDLHIRSTDPAGRMDDVVAAQKDKLHFILNYAHQHKAIILQAGDWHNSKRDFRALAMEIQILMKYQTVKIYAVAGQHDQYYRQQNAPSNLSILFHAGFIEHPGVFFENDNIYIHGCGWGESMSEAHHKAKSLMEVENLPYQILITHLPIAQEALFSTHKYIDSKDYLKKYPAFNYTLCGDIHKSFLTTIRGRTVANTGPLVRDGVDEMFHDPYFRIIEIKNGSLESDEIIEIPHTKGEEIFSREHLDQVQRRKDMVEQLHSIEDEKNSDVGSKITIEQAIASIIEDNDIDAETADYLYTKIAEGESNDQ